MPFSYCKCYFNNNNKNSVCNKLVQKLKKKKKVDSSADHNGVVKIIHNFRKFYMQWKTVCYKRGAPAQDTHKPS